MHADTVCLGHKLISQIIKLRMTEKIEFVDAIHGFRRKRGTYTAIGEAKLRIQQTMRSTHPLFQVYIDLKKAYDNLDRKVAMKILEKYGVGVNVRRYIWKIWEKQQFFLRQSGFYSDPIAVDQGVTQGDIDSPMYSTSWLMQFFGSGNTKKF